jgi:hypothetical protein
LNGDDQRHGFLLGRFIQSDILLHAVVFDNEVFGLKTVRDLSGFRPDESGNQNHVRFGSYCRKRLLGTDGQYDTEQDRQFETATSQSDGTTIQHESQLIIPPTDSFTNWRMQTGRAKAVAKSPQHSLTTQLGVLSVMAMVS